MSLLDLYMQKSIYQISANANARDASGALVLTPSLIMK